MSSVPLYDALAVDYDRFVSWPGRLARELPFLESTFQAHGVQSVLDSACGSGRHAIALAQRGYQSVGADLSAPMIEQARRNAAVAATGIPFVVAGFGQLATTLGKTFDAVLCLGNSLPHLLTPAAVAGALADFAAVLRPGGLLVVQNRNFDQVWAARDRFIGPQAHRDGEEEWLFVRFYDFHEETLTFNMVRLHRSEAGWTQAVDATELRPIFRDGLSEALAAAGFGEAAFYGSYDGSAFDPAASGDLIAVARKA
ncbi:MAG TPA: class I SAM-dependent methyltransferase [Anaerolineae bacterium]|nr:class I SAM-dependent methyltransferase [Anaerolineae bacterium]